MQNVIGNVGRASNVLDVALTVQAAAYATGEVIGGKITLTNAVARDGATALLQSVQLCSKADLTVDFDLILFSADPSATTFSENNAVAIDPADAAKVLGVVALTSRKDLGTPVVVTAANVGLVLKSAADSRNLYACLVVRGAHTPGSTSDLTLRLGLQLDQ